MRTVLKRDAFNYYQTRKDRDSPEQFLVIKVFLFSKTKEN